MEIAAIPLLFRFVVIVVHTAGVAAEHGLGAPRFEGLPAVRAHQRFGDLLLPVVLQTVEMAAHRPDRDVELVGDGAVGPALLEAETLHLLLPVLRRGAGLPRRDVDDWFLLLFFHFDLPPIG